MDAEQLIERLENWTPGDGTIATMRLLDDAANEIKRLQSQVEARGSVVSAATDAHKHLHCLITEWVDAEKGYFDISTKEGQRKVDRLDAAEDALRKAVGR